MQEMDNVQVIVEKEKYARDGVHKGMFGWICYPKCVAGCWLVNFPQCGDKDYGASSPETPYKPIPYLHDENTRHVHAPRIRLQYG